MVRNKKAFNDLKANSYQYLRITHEVLHPGQDKVCERARQERLLLAREEKKKEDKKKREKRRGEKSI